MPFRNLFLQPRVTFIKHLPAPSNLRKTINFSSQANSSNWVHHNQLFERHPRLQILEEQCKKTFHHLEQLLSYVFVSGLHRNPFVMSRILYLGLIELEGVNGVKTSDFGVRIFNIIEKPNIFSWNTMIRFFTGFDPVIALRYYMKMLEQEIFPDRYTFTFLLQACGASFDLCLVQQVHCHTHKLVSSDNLHVKNSLLSAYLVTSDSETHAQFVFDEMSERDIVSWTCLISGLVSQSKHRKALRVFQDLLANDDRQTRPNPVTIVSTMSACASLGSMDLTKCLHSHLEKSGWLELDVSVVNSLIDAYAKSGDLYSLRKVFDTIQTSKRDLYSWTAIISGYAIHGRGLEALNIFSQMEKEHGLIPDHVTFVSILSACAHSGLVEQGLRVFYSMITKYRIEPNLKHYGCIVDLLGRAGMVERAYNIVENMPMEPNLAVLGSLLNGCRLHNNLEFGKGVLRKIENLNKRGGADVLLSNIYANENEWGEVIKIRKEMRERVKGKPPGRSWIQIKDEVHEFIARNETEPKAVELHVVLEGLEKLSRLQ
ncbi:putative pentatricopeptide repeat-containing protein at3g28640 [Phtheirospermum japonicum]|uniref:Putative pentatricopeptide repeat-containing protein at3g28640 n=1 Tax=Phtheirospermum japonicum TaxID=374723 RepID=A0A830C8F5_9LAMI|nr:putative pentatricopeptide repeat-containing protein at3g28640 [Phtheirospermum japonicum]